MTHENGLVKMKSRQRQIEKERKIKIDISKTQYPLLRSIVVNQLGWSVWGREDQKGDANLFWSDTYVTEEVVRRLKPYQRINHFPNSQELGKKNLLSDNLKKMKVVFPKEYNFFPETWNLPQQSSLFDSYESQISKQSSKKKWLIVKPTASSQGRGIYLTRSVDLSCKQPKVVQQYINNPLLIQGCKFDLRIYVFIKSLIPLKIFRFEEGLMRLSTAPYEDPSKNNKSNLNMHLTNYAINKWSPSFVQNKSIEQNFVGHKRSLTAVFQYLSSVGCDQGCLKSQIDQIIVKTVFAAYPKLIQSYKQCRDIETEIQSTCFQILGFDILIDNNFKPWLLEVNHSPSFCTDSPLDLVVKKYLLLDTLVLLNLNAEDKESFLKYKIKEKQAVIIKDKDAIKLKRRADQQFEQSHMGSFQKIYPNGKKVYSTILTKLSQKKHRSILSRRQQIKSDLEKSHDLEEKSAANAVNTEIPLLNIIKSNKNINSLTLYGKMDGLKVQTHQTNPQTSRSQTQEQVLKRHLFLERDKRKYIEPIKMNNVNISFFEGAKTYYNYGYFGKRSVANQRNQKANISSHNPSQSVIFQPKTSEGGRSEVRKLDYEIRMRIQRMKLARIKIHKIQSKQRRSEPHSQRVMADPLRFELNQLRGQNKYI